MLTGKPPFQSATTAEIYRKARILDYDWPKQETSDNFVSDETKDLVSKLLQTPEERPDPDTIVQHSFFTCGYMPASEEITSELRESSPTSDHFMSTLGRRKIPDQSLRNLKKLSIKSEVGPWTQEKPHTSTYREVAAEETAGLTPAIPLPEDVVYRPFDEWLREQAKEVVEHGENSNLASGALNKIIDPIPVTKIAESAIPPHSRPSAQSFAAQQRARPQSSAVNPTSRTRKPSQEGRQNTGSSAGTKSGGMLTLPKRNPKNSVRKAESHASQRAFDVEERLAADLADQLNTAEAERNSREDPAPASSRISASLFHPEERLELLPKTSPDHVLDGLHRLQAELERALNSRSQALAPKSPPSTPTLVVKWVDYTNKFGLGYILSNGSVGCIFKATPADPSDAAKGLIPPSCVLVRDAERHLQNRANETYPDRHQIVPISGPNIEFYENRGEQGISRGKVNPQNYKIAVKDGEAGKLHRGRDEWDDRKREKIVLWKKFANYMTAFGRDQDFYDEIPSRVQQSDTVAAGNVVTFYQRFGDVGIWGFCDGHFQVCLLDLIINLS